uniref:Interleukin enhancer binding factor 3b n=1 Tax=Tetraodon nigroviridis TaxID=99883 RepID=H3CSC5_TETNG
DQATRTLRGVMRVGLVAKGLLLKGDLDLELVLFCRDKPTGSLLRNVSENLVTQLKLVATEDKYVVTAHLNEACIIIKNSKEPPLALTIHLTSPVVREDVEKVAAGESLSVNDPLDVLDRQKCLTALASLRHAKWFQARANGLRSCVIVIRILRDLCARVPTWTPLHGWPLELICEKAIGTGNRPMGAGEALRRVLECLASGILLADGAGISDPCEKESIDAINHLNLQQREDITISAQHALRLSAFGQLHKVLGMDPLPSKMPKKPRSETSIEYTVQIPPSTTYTPSMKRPIEEEDGMGDKSPNKKKKKLQKKSPEEKADLPQTMNALMRLNQLKPGLQYKLVSQTGPVHVPVFTMSVEVDGTVFEASGPSKRTAKLHVAVKKPQVLETQLLHLAEDEVCEVVEEAGHSIMAKEVLPLDVDLELMVTATVDTPQDSISLCQVLFLFQTTIFLLGRLFSGMTYLSVTGAEKSKSYKVQTSVATMILQHRSSSTMCTGFFFSLFLLFIFPRSPDTKMGCAPETVVCKVSCLSNEPAPKNSIPNLKKNKKKTTKTRALFVLHQFGFNKEVQRYHNSHREAYYYNYDGKNGEGGLSKSPSAQGSYYQSDGHCIPLSAAKALKKKPTIHKGAKPLFQSSVLGQASFNQYGQIYGQGKRGFSQNQGGTDAYTCNTAYPIQVTGGAGGSQEYNYEGFSSQSNYNSQGSGEGGNQGFGANHSQYHDPGGYSRGDAGMNYQYR